MFNIYRANSCSSPADQSCCEHVQPSRASSHPQPQKTTDSLFSLISLGYISHAFIFFFHIWIKPFRACTIVDTELHCVTAIFIISDVEALIVFFPHVCLFVCCSCPTFLFPSLPESKQSSGSKVWCETTTVFCSSIGRSQSALPKMMGQSISIVQSSSTIKNLAAKQIKHALSHCPSMWQCVCMVLWREATCH